MVWWRNISNSAPVAGATLDATLTPQGEWQLVNGSEGRPRPPQSIHFVLCNTSTDAMALAVVSDPSAIINDFSEGNTKGSFSTTFCNNPGIKGYSKKLNAFPQDAQQTLRDEYGNPRDRWFITTVGAAKTLVDFIRGSRQTSVKRKREEKKNEDKNEGKNEEEESSTSTRGELSKKRPRRPNDPFEALASPTVNGGHPYQTPMAPPSFGLSFLLIFPVLSHLRRLLIRRQRLFLLTL